jgi:predicted kinase
MRRAILVNGIPASGKTGVSRAIADATGWPLMTLDTVKEPFFDHLGTGDRAWNRSLGRASSQAIWSVVADWPDPVGVVVDAWFGFEPREILEAHIARARIGATVEVWCHAPAEVIVERYRARLGSRHPGHPGAEYIPEIAPLAARAAPLERGPVIAVDTTLPVDGPGLARRVMEAFGG